MSDADRTIVSGKVPGSLPSDSKRKPFLIIGGVGCLLLLCAILLIGGSASLYSGRFNNLIAGLTDGDETLVVETPTASPSTTPTPTEPSPTDTPTVETDLIDEADQAGTPSETATSAEAETPPASVEPEFSDLTFALGATETYSPIDPGLSFEEGITEIHAIFDYQGMSADRSWERVWYLDGNEILRNSAEWTGDEMGRFDYFIDAGGDPLSPGEWLLELYVDGVLLAEGSFAIEPEVTPEVAEVDNEAEHAADLDTPTPAATATRAATATPTAESTSSGGGTFQLVYTKWDGGKHNIYVADTNGSNERLIVTRGAGPSWTPDGQYIFFYGEEGVDRQIRNEIEYVNPNYSVSNGIVRLTMSPFPADVSQLDFFQGPGWNEGTARWANVAPNGQMVAFDARPGGGDYRIFFLGTSDNQQFQFQILGEQADWSPDSQKIVYRSGRNGITGLWISNRDDSGHANITSTGSDSFPAWSPDGKTIAFSRDQDNNVDIYSVNVDGSNLRRLTDAPGPDTLPVYTPTGDIIFRSARTGGWGIWKMSGAGADQTQIIPNAGVGPDWSFSRMSVR